MKRCVIALLFILVFSGCAAATEPQAALGINTPLPQPESTGTVVAFSVAEESTPEVTYAPTPEPTPEPESFRVVWIADTQGITSLHPETLDAMMSYASAQRNATDIRLLVHTGDIVFDFESRRQWTDVGEAFTLLGDLPFIAVCGNHDVGTDTLTYTRFGDYVAALYPDASRVYKNGRGSYTLLEEGGLKLMFAGIGWGYNDAAVEWLNSVIKAHPDYQCVLCLHSYLDADASRTDGGKIIFENVVQPNPNVKLVLCGHRDGEARLDTPLDDNGDGLTDRTVVQLMYNYQDVSEHKQAINGYLRVLQVFPSLGSVRVSTYSPVLDQYLTGQAQAFLLEGIFG